MDLIVHNIACTPQASGTASSAGRWSRTAATTAQPATGVPLICLFIQHSVFFDFWLFQEKQIVWQLDATMTEMNREWIWLKRRFTHPVDLKFCHSYLLFNSTAACWRWTIIAPGRLKQLCALVHSSDLHGTFLGSMVCLHTRLCKSYKTHG